MSLCCKFQANSSKENISISCFCDIRVGLACEKKTLVETCALAK